MPCAIPPLDQSVTAISRGFGPGYNRERTRRDQHHGGLDFIADRGSVVLAPIPGTVVFVSDNDGPRITAEAAKAGSRGQVRRMAGYGNVVVLRHDFDVPGLPNPFWTTYNHLRDPATLTPGQRVNAGDRLGYVGNTTNGQFRGMGPHLHMELRRAEPPGPVGRDSYRFDTMDPSVLFAALGIDWVDHHTEVGREVGGRMLVRAGGPSDPAVCSVGGVRGLFGFGVVASGYLDPAAIALKTRYTSKGTTSSTQSPAPASEALLPPEYAPAADERTPASADSGEGAAGAFVVVGVVLLGLWWSSRRG